MTKYLKQSRYFLLLVSLSLLFIVYPFFSGVFSQGAVFQLFFSIVLISALFINHPKRINFRVAIALMVPSIAFTWAHIVYPPLDLMLWGMFFQLMFLSFIATRIVIRFSMKDEIELDQIFGSVCVYFLIGMIWAIVYFMIEDIFPGSFKMVEVLSSDGEAHNSFRYLHNFMYFSFSTLSTLGYGDITPSSPVARSLTSIEAMMGQFYMAVLVARWVGLHIADTIYKKKVARKK